jgi:hypothetical protein
MKNINHYKRIGTDYYREVLVPMTNDNVKCLKKWQKQTMIDDYGKAEINRVKKFHGFCCIPSHVNFRKDINGFYNRYQALSYHIDQAGDWNKIQNFLRHIFGEQYELGLDYLKILWKNPTQVLPILCLVSDEKNTGKTTYLNLLKAIFEANMTLNTNEEFRSQFNSDWVAKLIIAVDEVLLEKREDSERIKNLSTARYYKVEAKGKDKEEVEFFGTFVLCSNNEENFIKIDANEIRYWVRKIPSLGTSVDPNLLHDFKKEVPFFANFLTTQKINTVNLTRMWFTTEQIHTEALDVLKRGNKTSAEKELEELLKDEFAAFDINELCYTTKNLHEMLKSRGVFCSSGYITKILKDKYNLVSDKNSSYKWYRSDLRSDGNHDFNSFTSEKGRYFTFARDTFAK